MNLAGQIFFGKTKPEDGLHEDGDAALEVGLHVIGRVLVIGGVTFVAFDEGVVEGNNENVRELFVDSSWAGWSNQ